MLSNTNKGLTYADAGVDIDAGNKAVELMKDSVKATYRPEVLGLRFIVHAFFLRLCKYILLISPALPIIIT